MNELAAALAYPAVGRRAKTPQTVRRYAEKLGHRLGRFETRHYVMPHSTEGKVMYRVAWCVLCNAAAFAGDDPKAANPALDNECNGSL